MKTQNDVSGALRDCLISPNVPDSNWEASNVVDALAEIARALCAVAAAIEGCRTKPPEEPTQ